MSETELYWKGRYEDTQEHLERVYRDFNILNSQVSNRLKDLKAANAEVHRLESEVARLKRELEGVKAHMNACRSLVKCPADEVLYEHLKAFFTSKEGGA